MVLDDAISMDKDSDSDGNTATEPSENEKSDSNKSGCYGNCLTDSQNLDAGDADKTMNKVQSSIPFQMKILEKTSALLLYKRKSKITERYVRQTLICEICGKSTKRRADLYRHMRTHTGERPYQCDCCSKSFSDKSGFLRHRRALHKDVKELHKKEDINGVHPSIATLDAKQHMTVDKNQAERVKVKTPGGQESKMLDQGIKRSITCEHCGRTFRKKSDFIKHVRRHTGEKPYACEHCLKSFSESSALNRHIRIHSGDKPYTCPLCLKKFSCGGNLQKHIRSVHTDVKPYTCDVCDKSFSDTSDLRRHFLIHSGETPFSCHICGKDFNVQGNLRKHIMTHTGEKPHQCIICKKLFRLKSHVKRHYESHLRKEAGIIPSDGKSYFSQAKLKELMTFKYGEDIGNQLSSGEIYNLKVIDENAEEVLNQLKLMKQSTSLNESAHVNIDIPQDFYPANEAKDTSDSSLSNSADKKSSSSILEKSEIGSTSDTGIPNSSNKEECDLDLNKPTLMNKNDEEKVTTEIDHHMDNESNTQNIDGVRDPMSVFRRQTYLHKIDDVISKLVKKCSSLNNKTNKSNEVKTVQSSKNISEDVPSDSEMEAIVEKNASEQSTNNVHMEPFDNSALNMTIDALPDPYSCNICGRTFKGKGQLSCHQKIHIHVSENDSSLLYQCAECGKKFAQSKYLQRHMKRHYAEKPFKCSVCSKDFSEKGYLERHFRIHTGVKPHSCEICGKEFPERGSLSRHLRIHTGEKPYSCEVCEKTFNDISTYRRHTLIHGDPENKPFECNVCNKKFTDSSNLRRHMKTHLPEECKEYQCDVCYKFFRFQAELTRHGKTHMHKDTEKAHKCEICGKEFHEKCGLTRHFRTHTGEKPYSCEICQKSFSDRSTYRRHTRIHNPETKHQHACDICDKSYSDPSNLRRHRKKHFTDTGHDCEICSKTFQENWELQRHMKTHKTTMEIDCAECGQTFNDLDSVSTHIAIEHKNKPSEMKHDRRMYIRNGLSGSDTDDEKFEFKKVKNVVKTEKMVESDEEQAVYIKNEVLSD